MGVWAHLLIPANGESKTVEEIIDSFSSQVEHVSFFKNFNFGWKNLFMEKQIKSYDYNFNIILA